MIGGIDVGGTKIEARVFDAAFKEVSRHRIPTPRGTYADLIDAIAAQVAWIESHGVIAAIGLGTPGLINPVTGVMLTANLPATGQRLGPDIAAKAGRLVAILNDCRAFTLAEATLGAGQGYRSVVGFVIGTGVAGGHAINGQIVPDLNGQHGEFGHLPIPAAVIADLALPLLPCGCGLTGCFETYSSGPGLQRMAQHMTGQTVTTDDILARMPKVREAWVTLIAGLIAIVTRTSDPEVIVLGGGLGMIDGLAEEILGVLLPFLLRNTDAPAIVQALHGDASGALGAALFAWQQMQDVAE